MNRRRRISKDIPFSFDSFLDVVANVVGIIIRLILVVWVGAKSYSSIQHLQDQVPPPESMIQELRLEPLEEELARYRRELEMAEKLLLDRLRDLEFLREDESRQATELARIEAQRRGIEVEQAHLLDAAKQFSSANQATHMTLADLRARRAKLAEQMDALAKLPAPKQTLRYRMPVSRPVQTEEFLFECKEGRVTFIDLASMLVEVKYAFEEAGEKLKSTWEISETTTPVGAFRLKYTIERERTAMDSTFGGPGGHGSFRYGLSGWVAQPVAAQRGETLSQALTKGSEFRSVVDPLDPRQVAITFCVYPDSFDLFRRLRDYLYERDFVVAGRPLPEGIPIASSRRGTVSRGQ